MSLVGFTFGSFGDIITIIQLANKVRKLLSESSGASAEYQQLILEIDTSLFILHLVYGASQFQSADASPLSTNAQQTIQQCVKKSEDILRELDGKLFKFQESLEEGGTGKKLLDYWGKIRWGFFTDNYLIETRRKLAEQRMCITLLLGVNNKDPSVSWVSVGGWLQPGESTHSILGHAWDTNVAAFATMRVVEGKDFDDFIRFYFRDRPGKRLVERGDYEVISSSGSMQTSARWEISPGATVMMNARVQRPANREVDPKAAICPLCNLADTRNADTGINWWAAVYVSTRCKAWFMTSHSTIDELEEDRSPTQEHHGNDSVGGPSLAASSRNRRPERRTQKQSRRGARTADGVIGKSTWK
ncbi:uncharacterized protein STEHIDRAFT_109525 [Stereum hirsutum FP-91666 SS1]|uniref:uncharacterized protein n=1 Tax=Stereum hirsutum (strain FP-91666) TaxID=721885 RepID=UPI000440B650|nr:uncharacterized protein STEHIDRAFT_109525 [Stereum hirsutum FP-91666 SS1]EIM89299.1 hypothetical protein STEHIDRAFT_109525 [Stereum hirsutum FP-91666 SS1]